MKRIVILLVCTMVMVSFLGCSAKESAVLEVVTEVELQETEVQEELPEISEIPESSELSESMERSENSEPQENVIQAEIPKFSEQAELVKPPTIQETTTQETTAQQPTQKEEPTMPKENLPTENTSEEVEFNSQSGIRLTANGVSFSVTLEQNSATEALLTMLANQPISIRMSDYGGFEKIGSLGTSLPSSNRQMTTKTGDIVLYNGSSIVVFYGANAWSYTKLGTVDDLSGFVEALGSGDVEITFSIEP